ncbi:hypothetical protein F-M6_0283 [Faustovirus]|nr:hypothetical protein F-M6_0283 [Faustovirus]
MEWFVPDLMFAMFTCDSGVIPSVYRVCRQWRGIAGEYIRMYRDHALTINVKTTTDINIHTTTTDGAMNGLYVTYDYVVPPNASRHRYLAPTSVAEMCNNLRHGRTVEFTTGDCCNIIYYVHGERVHSVQYETFNTNWLRELLHKLRLRIDAERQKLISVKRCNVEYLFNESGQLQHKLMYNEDPERTLKKSLLMRWQNDTIRFKIKQHGSFWITNFAYYNQDGSLKALFMQPYHGTSGEQTEYDTGYKFVEHVRPGVVMTPVYIYDSTGMPVFIRDSERNYQDTWPHCEQCYKCNKWPRFDCHACIEKQMRREFNGMWTRINKVISVKTLRNHDTLFKIRDQPKYI